MSARSRAIRADAHLKVLADISHLANQEADLNSILSQVVDKISGSMGFDVVSTYVYDGDRDELVLAASHGLKMDAGHPVHMKPNEGLTGLVYETRRTLAVTPASRHPRFKYFPETGENKYESYLGVPMLIQNRCLGVLVGQMADGELISPAENTLFEIIAARIAGLLEVSDSLQRLRSPAAKAARARTLQGKGVCGDFATGKAYIMRGLFRSVFIEQFPPGSPSQESIRLSNAVSASQDDLSRQIAQLSASRTLSAGTLNILKTHLALMQDKVFINALTDRIKSEKISAEVAIVQEVEAIVRQFDAVSDSYLRERSADFREIGNKLLSKLMEHRGTIQAITRLPEDTILVAHELGASLIAGLGNQKIAGMISEVGGETSHAVIMAQSLGIPLVTGIANATGLVSPAERMLVDGRTGFVFVNPDLGLIKEYEDRRKETARIKKVFEKQGADSSGSAVDLHISANIGSPSDIKMASQYHLQDVGLFRTEFAFMQFTDWPSVEQQERVYSEFASGFSGYVTLRTLDIGGDKVLPYMSFPKETNPLLGLRSIRFSMEYLDLFRQQLTAVLRLVKKGGRFRILLPMITNVWEVQTATRIIEELAGKLGLEADQLTPVGMMVETPASVIQLADYAPHIDFFSVGTNDLVQYTLAVDRDSDTIGHLYSGFHPAVIRTLKQIQLQAAAMNKDASICGELAANPAGALAMMALGYRHLSVVPTKAPMLRYLCKKITGRILDEVAQRILHEPQEVEIRNYLTSKLESIDPLFTAVS